MTLDKVRSLSSSDIVSSSVAAGGHFRNVAGGRKLTDDFDVDGTVLGTGLGGDVVLVRGKEDSRRYALKTVKKRQGASSKTRQMPTEVEIYLTLDHPNIARLHGVYETGPRICLLMECCEGGELYARLQKRGTYPDADAAAAGRQMFGAVQYLHALRVVHRDVKLENFLYESESYNSALKLIDFGFAKVWDPATLMMAPCGSISYVSPDVLLGKGYTDKCDLWSLGVIVWMLLAGYPPFHGEEKAVMAAIKAGKPDWSHSSRWKPVSDVGVDFIKRLLEKDPRRRLSAQEGLQHHWLNSGSPTRSPSRARQHMAGA